MHGRSGGLVGSGVPPSSFHRAFGLLSTPASRPPHNPCPPVFFFCVFYTCRPLFHMMPMVQGGGKGDISSGVSPVLETRHWYALGVPQFVPGPNLQFSSIGFPPPGPSSSPIEFDFRTTWVFAKIFFILLHFGSIHHSILVLFTASEDAPGIFRMFTQCQCTISGTAKVRFCAVTLL